MQREYEIAFKFNTWLPTRPTVRITLEQAERECRYSGWEVSTIKEYIGHYRIRTFSPKEFIEYCDELNLFKTLKKA